jgi:hypothetical protein
MSRPTPHPKATRATRAIGFLPSRRRRCRPLPSHRCRSLASPPISPRDLEHLLLVPPLDRRSILHHVPDRQGDRVTAPVPPDCCSPDWRSRPASFPAAMFIGHELISPPLFPAATDASPFQIRSTLAASWQQWWILILPRSDSWLISSKCYMGVYGWHGYACLGPWHWYPLDYIRVKAQEDYGPR